MSSVPVTYGEASITPRGDYAHCRADYTCAQHWERYTADQHALFARLYARQMALVPGRACEAFVRALPHLQAHSGIPRFADINARLKPKTGWEIVAVPGLIPESAFFTLLSQRRFPVTVWLRRPEEFDYIVEPDLFHDLFGHVPLLFEPRFADYMQAFGQGGLKAQGQHALQYLARLYWYTVEFGLIRSDQGLRIYGAGILSSGGEVEHSLHTPQARRLRFNLPRLLRSRYRIDTFQATYFIIDSFEQLFEATAPDFTPLYAQAAAQTEIEAGAVLPGEVDEAV
ncbi:phenylalanine 4-monooxygenase [Thiomonas bhubaneswarensis]|uniref:Phenylalanine-4-hydroxylase n=1 Tax=Thiomonas bhubaneswarensis TaxID=339866 RepID=A0A0K6I1X4_9BURK|nr:phenylalanine 4-monooxygenase [Thiomonas bhubaneswarensis]CUA97120.1 Phenylalanine 4-hydroxylase [Thiomonas bhubaneswarensis]